MNKSQLKKIRRRKKVQKVIKQKRLGIGKGCEGLRGRAIKDDWQHHQESADEIAAHSMKEIYEDK